MSRFPLIVYLIRHGETDWNRQGLLQGLTDIPLNTNGKNQAEQLAPHFAALNLVAAYSSNLRRAKETAQLILSSGPIPVVIDHRLNERAYGNWEGKEKGAYHSACGEKDPSIEPAGRVFERARAFLNSLVEKTPAPTGPILAVSHGAVIRILFHEILNYPIADGKIKVMNTGWAKLTFGPNGWSVEERKGIYLPEESGVINT